MTFPDAGQSVPSAESGSNIMDTMKTLNTSLT